MLKQHIQEALQGIQSSTKSCSCGCNSCDDASPKLALLETKTPISEGLRYHIENGISLQDNVFRMGSKKYLQLFSEARMLNEWKNISLDENSKFLIENTDIGKFGIHETVNFEGEEYDIISKDGDWVYLRSIHDTMVGKKEIKVKEKDITINEAKVPLDIPMLDEYSDENFNSLEDSIAQAEFGMDYDQLGPGEKEFVRDEIDNMSMNEGFTKEDWDVKWKLPKDNLFNASKSIDAVNNRSNAIQDLLKLNPKELQAFNNDDEHPAIEMSYDELMRYYHSIMKESVNEAKKKKKDPPIGKPKRSSSGGKAYKVFVRDPKTKKVKTVRFGSGGLRAKIRNPKARNAFAKRHDCKNKKDRTKASYWSCNLPRYAPALGLGPKMNTFW